MYYEIFRSYIHHHRAILLEITVGACMGNCHSTIQIGLLHSKHLQTPLLFSLWGVWSGYQVACVHFFKVAALSEKSFIGQDSVRPVLPISYTWFTLT